MSLVFLYTQRDEVETVNYVSTNSDNIPTECTNTVVGSSGKVVERNNTEEGDLIERQY
jgi:hypothetical protein